MIRERIGDIELELETHPGLFSPSKVDTGTRALISCIELAGNDKVLDLGCGYGVVGIWAARRIGAAKVWMLDNDPVAIELAKRGSVHLVQPAPFAPMVIARDPASATA